MLKKSLTIFFQEQRPKANSKSVQVFHHIKILIVTAGHLCEINDNKCFVSIILLPPTHFITWTIQNFWSFLDFFRFGSTN